MPFSSSKQMRWMFANRPTMAKEFADSTPNINALPEKYGGKPIVKQPRKRKRYGE